MPNRKSNKTSIRLSLTLQQFLYFHSMWLPKSAFPDYTSEREKTPPAFAAAKGGEKMKNSVEQRIQNQFGGFCTRVLKNEASRIHNEYARQREQEKSLEDLTPEELEQTAVIDKYFHDDHVFEVLGKQVVVTGDLLAEAIAKLPDKKRDIILLSYFLGLSDREISEHLHVVRQAVSKHRAGILRELREILQKEGFEWL